jgi:hypothetical protein
MTTAVLALVVCLCAIWYLVAETLSTGSGNSSPEKAFVDADPESILDDIFNDRVPTAVYEGKWFSWHGTVEKIGARHVEIHLADEPIRVRGMLTEFEMGYDPISWGHQLDDELGFEAKLTRIGYVVLDDNGDEYIVPSTEAETVNENTIAFKPTILDQAVERFTSQISEAGHVEAKPIGAVVHMEDVAFTVLSRHYPPIRAQ